MACEARRRPGTARQPQHGVSVVFRGNILTDLRQNKTWQRQILLSIVAKCTSHSHQCTQTSEEQTSVGSHTLLIGRLTEQLNMKQRQIAAAESSALIIAAVRQVTNSYTHSKWAALAHIDTEQKSQSKDDSWEMKPDPTECRIDVSRQ